MINNYILQSLNLYKVTNIEEFENVLRELVQEISLCALARKGLFNKVAFYGGTCLRIFYKLGRFSEDLDFNVLKEDTNFNWDDYIGSCKEAIESFGLNATIHQKEGYDNGEIRRRVIKIRYYELAKEYLGDVQMNKEQLLSVKLEVSMKYTEGATYELKTLFSPNFAGVLCYDFSSLFAGKLCALLTRAWANRVKGRDFYDYMFYLNNKAKINTLYFKNKLESSLGEKIDEISLEYIKEMLRKKFESTDFESVKKDIKPFVNDKYILDTITKETFINSLESLEY